MLREDWRPRERIARCREFPQGRQRIFQSEFCIILCLFCKKPLVIVLLCKMSFFPSSFVPFLLYVDLMVLTMCMCCVAMCSDPKGIVPESRSSIHDGGLWVLTGLLSQRAQAETWTAGLQTGHSEGTRGHQQLSGEWVSEAESTS